jgi:predicted CXXCH cytochrome family protein
MNAMRISSSWLPVALAAVGLCLAASNPLAQESCVSGACHAALLKGKTVHPATDSCETCHESVASPHPQAGKKTFKLAKEQPALCSDCHDPFGSKSHVHPPVQEGTCTTCHDPHSSNQPKLLAQPMKDLCESCHGDKAAFKHTHGPVSAGDCTACHSPHESDVAALLLKKGDDLCFGCHVDMANLRAMKHVHPALEGGCTSCHDPHGADYPKMLPAEKGQLCFQCHDDIAGIIEKASVTHPPVASDKACASCHSPHASDNPKLLLKPEKETCLSCHAALLTKSMTVLHGPIREGKCVSCHQPHGGANARLLVKSFSRDPYVPYTDAAYELCFSCHNRDLLKYPDTSFATGFRDGDRNLHYLHVNRPDKGRSCRLCHEFHGGDNPKLVAQSVPFAKWSLPIKFVKTETGGGCSPGCHKPQVYDRVSPGRKPPAASPPRGR